MTSVLGLVGEAFGFDFRARGRETGNRGAPKLCRLSVCALLVLRNGLDGFAVDVEAFSMRSWPALYCFSSESTHEIIQNEKVYDIVPKV